MPVFTFTFAAFLCAAPPVSDVYLMRLEGAPVGTVTLSVSESSEGIAFEYASETWVRRGPTITRNSARARLQLAPDRTIHSMVAERIEAGVRVHSIEGGRESDGLLLRVDGVSSRAPAKVLPASLVFGHFSTERRCLNVIDETTGRIGEACGRKAGALVEGELLGEPFKAVMGERLEKLELPGQRVSFTLASDVPDEVSNPPDLLGAPVPVAGPRGWEGRDSVAFSLKAAERLDLPSTACQSITRVSASEVVLRWTPARPDEATDWTSARELARQVYEAIPDKRPAAFERSPERVLERGRGACVAHVEAFVHLAKKRKLVVRRALGLAAAEGRLWPHAWVQVQAGGTWYDVDPTEGEAPARAPRVLFAAGERADERAAAKLARIVTKLRVEAK